MTRWTPLVSYNAHLIYSIIHTLQTMPLSLPGPDEESMMENEELLPLKRELAERAAAKQLDGYGYYL